MEISPVLTGLSSAQRQRSNVRMAVKLGFVALFFVGFGFAMVPLYDVICKITGLNGKTNAVAIMPAKNTQVDMSRSVKVEFLSHSMPGVGLSFKSEQFSMRVHPGEISHMNYTITNTTDQGTVIYREQFLMKKELNLDPVKAPRSVKVLDNAKEYTMHTGATIIDLRVDRAPWQAWREAHR